MLGNLMVMLITTILYAVFVLFIYSKICLSDCSPELKTAIAILNFGYIIFVIANSIAYAKNIFLKAIKQWKILKER